MRLSARFVSLAALLAAATWTVSGATTELARSARPSYLPSSQAAAQPGGAAMKNPIKPAPASTAAGKTLYDAQCASCHGTTGKGDGKMAAMMNPPKPSNLTDGTWKHGATDGDIFVVIRDGSKGTAMRGYGSRVQPEQIWNVVNYIRTIK